MKRVLLLVAAASLAAATTSAGYARGGGASGLRPERRSAPTDQLPDTPEPLVTHRAICSERTAACVAIQALRALLPDIGLRII